MARLEGYASQFQPGALSVGCPVCGERQILNREALADVEEGTHIIMPSCGHASFCFHCLDSGSVGVAPDGSRICGRCVMGVRNGIGCINHHFRRPGKTRFDGLPPLMRNFELSPDMIVEQLLRMAAGDVIHLSCAGCGIELGKSEACNSLRHCGITHCWHCGYASSPWNRHGLVDHFDGDGAGGRCPRFDDDPYWDRFGAASMCTSACQGHNCGDCQIPEHAAARQTQTFVRKNRHIRDAFSSIPPSLRISVMEKLLWHTRSGVQRDGLDFLLSCLASVVVGIMM
jgi:hypothetical protein